MIKRFYAGIGSRETPKSLREDIMDLSSMLESLGFWLRSGGAEGADLFFESGVVENAQIWVPWQSFNEKQRFEKHTYKVIGASDREANLSVNKYHPNGMNLRDGARKLMARNYRQVIGKDEPNSEFIICWTEGGLVTGGTAQAIRIAQDFKIPVYNLFNLSKQEILNKINANN